MTVCYRYFNKAGLLRNKGRLLENKDGLLRAKIAYVQIAYDVWNVGEKRRRENYSIIY